MSRYTSVTSDCRSFNQLEMMSRYLLKDNFVSTNLNTPRSIAFDGNFMYITNSEGNNIVKSTGVYTHFKPTTSEVIIWASNTGGGSVIAMSSLNKPWGIAIDGENMYVSNSGNNTITKIENFKTSSNIKSYIWAGQTGAVINDVPLNGPRDIVIKNNHMYITNFYGNSITKIENFRDSPSSLSSTSTSIDFVKGWSGNHENPGGYVSGYEDCRQKALNSNGRYVAWGFRNSNHPDPAWRNTCFLYTAGFPPYNGDPNDNVHLTGCLRPGEKVNLGCNIPPGSRGYTMTFTNSNLLNGPYGLVFDGDVMYVSCATGKNIIKIENGNASVFVSNLTDPYGLAFKNGNFYFISGVVVMILNRDSKIVSPYIGSLNTCTIKANLYSPIGVFISNEDMYITNSGTNSITKILKFQPV